MRRLPSQKEMSRLIGRVYDCVIDRGGWSGAIDEIRIEFDFANAFLNLIDMKTGHLVFNVAAGVEPDWLERVSGYGADVVEQWGGVESMQAFPLDQPMVLSRVRSRDLWKDNRFYQEWGIPQGIHDTLAMPLSLNRLMAGSLGMGRHSSMGEIGDIEVEAAAILLPHVQRSVAIGGLLDFTTVKAATFEATIDKLSVAIFLTDESLSIVHANAAAEEMLREGRPVHAKNGHIALPYASASRALMDAVCRAARDPTGMGRHGLGVPVRDAETLTSVIYVLPLHVESAIGATSARAAAAIFVAPSPRAIAPMEVLAAMFDLTGAEARVFSAAAAGLTRLEIGQSLRIGQNTVKTHLAHIFLKTGTHSHADLVALNSALSLPLMDYTAQAPPPNSPSKC